MPAASALQLTEEAGVRELSVLYRLSGSHCPTAVLTPEATWSEFFWGLCAGHQAAHCRSHDLGSMSGFHKLTNRVCLQPLVTCLRPSVLSQVLYLEYLLLCHPSTTRTIYECFLKASQPTRESFLFFWQALLPPIFTCLNSQWPVGH